MSMKYVIRNISKQFQDLRVLENISMDFEEDKVTCILGPSGCGKSTLLNIVASIIQPDQGSVEGFDRESLSFIFQEDRLIEWKTVEENLDFVLKGKVNKEQSRELIEKHLRRVGLYEFRKYYPGKLSGGMRQRVSIARAFACPSRVLVMDEPFKSLDASMKLELMKCFDEMIGNNNKTVLFVTHDIEEALLLGDKIMMLTEKPARVCKVVKNTIPRQERWERDHRIELLRTEVLEGIFPERNRQPSQKTDRRTAVTGAVHAGDNFMKQ